MLQTCVGSQLRQWSLDELRRSDRTLGSPGSSLVTLLGVKGELKMKLVSTAGGFVFDLCVGTVGETLRRESASVEKIG